MYSFLFELLRDPITNEPLYFDIEKEILIGSYSRKEYPVIQGVPKILMPDNQSINKSKVHSDFGTRFDYSNHYQIDSEVFDYSEKNIAGVTKDEYKRLRESIKREIPGNIEIILDVGCGGGWVSNTFLKEGKKVISLDISDNNPIKAIKESEHINHAGLIADVYNLPFNENSIDCIIASEVLEHVSDPKRFIENLIKVLKPNGVIVLTTPYNEKIIYQLCVHCNKLTPQHAHLHVFNENNISIFIPLKGVTWTSKNILNKFLLKSRFYLILNFLPFQIWRIIDLIANKILNKPTRLLISIKKI
jgi:2-polyprenyl-3-methyl-5-hydroxy-6-metoxy-1,4-benzoquinol methylase/uncharacterized protein YbaR (Trm112 family)